MIELSKNISSYIETHFGKEYLNFYTEYFNGEYKPYIRISPLTISKEKIISNLEQYGIKLISIPGIENTYQVIQSGNIIGKTFDFILGSYYIQSLSSMIPALVLNPYENDRVLDLCAAPGSKTTQLAEIMNNKGTLIANEISLDRARILLFNTEKQSLVNTGVINSKGELLSKYFENYFDKILVDAPCSALGITQKKGEVSNWWNEQKAEGLSEIQYRLLVSAIKMCKVGGEIVYSTCTLTLEENELVLNKILNKYQVELVDIELPVKSRPAFTKYENENLNSQIAKAHRILPWEIGSEGFFVSKLRKIESTEPTVKQTSHESKFWIIDYANKRVKQYLDSFADYYGVDKSQLENFRYINRNGDLYFVNSDWDYEDVSRFLRLGLKFGTIDKRNVIQLNSFAVKIFSNAITKNLIELNNKSDLEIYLKGGTIKKDLGSYGQKVIKYDEYFVGTAVSSKDGLKSQFPRTFRTQEIILV